MANETVLPGSISIAEHLRQIDLLVAQRFADLDISMVLINIFDTVPAVALPFLAEQFNVLGYKGWKYADTEQKQRDLLKQSIDLNRYSGTPDGLRAGLRIAGVTGDIEIREQETIRHDSRILHNGRGYYGNHWAYFSVILDLVNQGVIPIEDLQGVIEEYKGERNWLLTLGFKQVLQSDVDAEGAPTDVEIKVVLDSQIDVDENLITTQI